MKIAHRKPKTGRATRRQEAKRSKTRPIIVNRIATHSFPHTRAGRPKIVDDMVGTPV